MSFHTVSGCQRSEARARQLSSLLSSSFSLCSPLSGCGTAGAEESSACLTCEREVLSRRPLLAYQLANNGIIQVLDKCHLCEDASCPPGALPPARRRLVGGGDLGPRPRPEPAIDQARLERGVSEASDMSKRSENKLCYHRSPLTHGPVADVAAGPDELGARGLHLGPDQPPLLLGLEADQVHAPLLAPVPGPRPVPHHCGQVRLLVASRYDLLLLGRQQF